ncbi:MAG: hypothetical protein AAF989_01100 [Planctomycetota bacterium]
MEAYNLLACTREILRDSSSNFLAIVIVKIDSDGYANRNACDDVDVRRWQVGNLDGSTGFLARSERGHQSSTNVSIDSDSSVHRMVAPDWWIGMADSFDEIVRDSHRRELIGL